MQEMVSRCSFSICCDWSWVLIVIKCNYAGPLENQLFLRKFMRACLKACLCLECLSILKGFLHLGYFLVSSKSSLTSVVLLKFLHPWLSFFPLSVLLWDSLGSCHVYPCWMLGHCFLMCSLACVHIVLLHVFILSVSSAKEKKCFAPFYKCHCLIHDRHPGNDSLMQFVCSLTFM